MPADGKKKPEIKVGDRVRYFSRIGIVKKIPKDFNAHTNDHVEVTWHDRINGEAPAHELEVLSSSKYKSIAK